MPFGRIVERARCTVAGRSWELAREHWRGGAFTLKQTGRVFASVEKPSALVRSFRLKFDSTVYRWQAESAFGRSFHLLDGVRVMGSMRHVHAFTRRATIKLPDELSPERKAFLVWLVLLMWRRQHNSS